MSKPLFSNTPSTTPLLLFSRSLLFILCHFATIISTCTPQGPPPAAFSSPQGSPEFFLIPLPSESTLLPSDTSQPATTPSTPPRLQVSDLDNSEDEFHTPSSPDPTTTVLPTPGPSQTLHPEEATAQAFNQAIANALQQCLDPNKPKDVKIMQKSRHNNSYEHDLK